MNDALEILRNIDKPADDQNTNEALAVLLSVADQTPTFRDDTGELQVDDATASLEEIASGIKKDAERLIQLLERQSKDEIDIEEEDE